MLLASPIVFGAGVVDISYSPFTITRSGSYLVVDDIQVAQDQYGIYIRCSNVSIDLNGHTLYGAGTATGSSGTGIYAVSTANNISIKNGTVRDFRSGGVRLSGRNNLVMQVHAIGNRSTGIEIKENSTVKDCIAAENGSYGFSIGFNCNLSGNNSYQNRNYGISTDSCCTIINNTVSANENYGIVAGICSAIIGNTVSNNTGAGILARSGGTVINNSVYRNKSWGIYAEYNCSVIGNNTYYNSASGIYAGSGSSVLDNTSNNNTSHGIYAIINCRIVGNTCLNNGLSTVTAAGIYVGNSDSVIEDNLCLGNDYGLQISASGNYYARNKFSGNTTNLSIVGGNTAGTGDNVNIQFYYNDAPIQIQLAGIVMPFAISEYKYPLEQMLRW
jgi:parallel beta-helix repeat protein